MRPSPRRLPALNAHMIDALVAFPPANALTGQSLLQLSAMRRSAATAAHMLREACPVHVVAPQQLRSDLGFFLDPNVPVLDQKLNLGLVGATAVPVLADDQLRICDFTFNAWGDQDLPQRWDNRFGSWLAGDRGVDSDFSLLSFSASDMVHDGNGTLVLSEQTLLYPQRNPGWSKGAIERELDRLLGAERFVWIPGRARTSAFFTDDRTAVVQIPQEFEDSFEQALEIAALIEGGTNAAGEHYNIATINPSVSGHSYLDVLVVNDHVFVPSYAEDSDAAALQVFQDLYPGKLVQQWDSRAVAHRGLSWSDVVLLIPQT
ncbi:agmatine deiminase family protein [Micrococcoides hystricis]|uniref:Agmatine deiminase family protein n=1 Tax=Micrococcoides hystricis TaxID=1572761 RepID=A0ABV6PDW3_9MICC